MPAEGPLKSAFEDLALALQRALTKRSLKALSNDLAWAANKCLVKALVQGACRTCPCTRPFSSGLSKGLEQALEQ